MPKRVSAESKATQTHRPVCLTRGTVNTNCFLSSLLSILDLLSLLLLFSSHLRLLKKVFPIFELSFLLIVFIMLLPAPLSCLPQCSPSSPPAFHIPSCRALSSNNFFVSWSDESPYIIVSKMEQRCPIPGSGGAREEEGTGSCTCQADSGFEIPEEQNKT